MSSVRTALFDTSHRLNLSRNRALRLSEHRFFLIQRELLLGEQVIGQNHEVQILVLPSKQSFPFTHSGMEIGLSSRIETKLHNPCDLAQGLTLSPVVAPPQTYSESRVLRKDNALHNFGKRCIPFL